MYSSRFARRSVSVDMLAVRPSNLSGEHMGKQRPPQFAHDLLVSK